MTRKYVKFDPNSDDVYCACGCGKVLTRMQRYKNGKYASEACALKVRRERIAAEQDISRSKNQCLCGCGQSVAVKDVHRGFPFVNKEHEKKYKFELYEKEELRKKEEAKRVYKKYCDHYDHSRIFCLLCYEDGAGMYRGCYGKPKETKQN